MSGPSDERRALPDLPEDARIWIFGADRLLSGSEASRLSDSVGRFLEGWAAHGQELAAGHEWLHDRFLVIAVDERRAPPSGCSIDALVRHLRQLEREFGVELVDGSAVWFRSDGEIRRVGREKFRQLAAEGTVDGDSVVFDLTVQRLGELRAGRWEMPARASWHARLLGGRGGRGLTRPA